MKILVFVTNILLTAVAVFVIRERDQARLNESQKDTQPENSAANSELPSLKGSIEVVPSPENDAAANTEEAQLVPLEVQDSTGSASLPAADINPVPIAPSTAPPAAAPEVKPVPPDRKTRTS